MSRDLTISARPQKKFRLHHTTPVRDFIWNRLFVGIYMGIPLSTGFIRDFSDFRYWNTCIDALLIRSVSNWTLPPTVSLISDCSRGFTGWPIDCLVRCQHAVVWVAGTQSINIDLIRTAVSLSSLCLRLRTLVQWMPGVAAIVCYRKSTQSTELMIHIVTAASLSVALQRWMLSAESHGRWLLR